MQPDLRTPPAHRAKYKTICLVLTVLCVVATRPVPARAQLSPGDLSAPHAHLEGLRKCGQCHHLGDRDVRDRCLDCHGDNGRMDWQALGYKGDPMDNPKFARSK